MTRKPIIILSYLISRLLYRRIYLLMMAADFRMPVLYILVIIQRLGRENTTTAVALFIYSNNHFAQSPFLFWMTRNINKYIRKKQRSDLKNSRIILKVFSLFSLSRLITFSPFGCWRNTDRTQQLLLEYNSSSKAYGEIYGSLRDWWMINIGRFLVYYRITFFFCYLVILAREYSKNEFFFFRKFESWCL